MISNERLNEILNTIQRRSDRLVARLLREAREREARRGSSQAEAQDHIARERGS